MPIVWRLTPPAYATTLDGEGSRLVGGRWNKRGTPVVYTSSHLSLCVLETYVHLPPMLRNDLPEMEAVGISVPDTARTTLVSAARFKSLLAQSDAFSACQALGEEWFSPGDVLVLQVPSVIVPRETNLILNTQHPQMRDVRIVSAEPFRFDPRLSQGG